MNRLPFLLFPLCAALATVTLSRPGEEARAAGTPSQVFTVPQCLVVSPGIDLLVTTSPQQCLLANTGPASVPPPVGANYFSQAMLAQMVPLRTVLRQHLAMCPKDNATTNITGSPPYQTGFPLFPMSVCMSQDMVAEASSTWTGGKVVHFWPEQRFQDPLHKVPLLPAYPRPDLATGGKCWLVYSRYQTAEAATRAGIAYSVGAAAHQTSPTPGYLDITEAAGITDSQVMAHDAFYAAQDTLCSATYTAGGTTYRVAPKDTVVLPQGRLADVHSEPNDGITVDYEPLDGRSETACTGCGSVAELEAEAALAHAYGYHFRVYTNPLETSNSATYNDYAPANLVKLFADPQIDHMSIIIDPSTYLGGSSNGDPHAEFIAEITAANGGTLPSKTAAFLKKVSATVTIGTQAAGSFTLAEMATIKNDLDSWGITEVNLFPKGSDQGGQVCPPPTNPVLARIAIILGLTLPC